MKLTAFLLLVLCLHAAAHSTAQTVTIKVRDVPIRQVFREIQKQTGLNFMVDEALLEKTRTVTIDVKDMTVDDVLALCLKNEPLDYTIANGRIIVRAVSVLAPATLTDSLPRAEIRGHVTDSIGNSLAGATVTVRGKRTVVLTDERGNFRLPVTTASTVVVISYIGYMSAEVMLNNRQINNFTIVLRHGDNPLDAVQLIAYGTDTKRFSIGSTATVTAKDIERQPVTNVLLALQGQVPGLAINATSGVPGSQVLVQVRGQNTIANTPFGFKPYDQPLFIIDGVPFAPQNSNISQLSSLSSASNFAGGISASGGISPFNSINPNDIESITILKDADATSIYGTQGSNGVVLITTKKGKPGNTNFSLTATTGYNSDARKLKLLNTQQYLDLRKTAFAADGITPSSSPYDPGYAPDLTVYDQTKYTNWDKAIYGKTSNNTDLHASLSGGTFNNTFLISAGFTRSNFNYPGNFADQRLTLHSAFHHSSLDGRLMVDFGTDYGYDQNNSPGFGGARNVLLAPNTPDLLDAKGNLLWTYKGIDLSPYQFYAFLKQPVNLHNYNLNNTFHLSYRILNGLSFGVNMGYSRTTSSGHSENPASAQSPLYRYVTASFTSNVFQTINIEPQLDYTRTIGKGVLTALLGGSYKKNLTSSENIQGTGYANDNFLGSINGAAQVFVTDNSGIYKYSAGFARLKYVYDRRYIVSITGRRDGSSNFGPGNQFGNFGSAGLGWIFAEEKGFKTLLPFISFAKLSGNYGTSGSDGIAAYQYQAFWQPLSYVPAFQGVQPNVPQNLYNPNYSWALKKSLNVALDLGFFHDRVLMNATYYRDREGNQLAGYPLPSQVGFSSVLENVPANIQNSGWEFAVNSNTVKTKNFSWTTTFNISFNRNKLISFPNLAASSYKTQYIIGKPTSIIMGYRFDGVNPTTGLFQYLNSKGQDTIRPNYGLASAGGDQYPIADREVKFMGGFGNTVTYKHFSLFLFFQFSSQNAPTYLATLYSSFFPGQSAYNQPVQVLDYWKQPGDHTSFQKLTTQYGSDAYTAASNFNYSSGAFGNDTYVRLKTVALSYALPETFLKKAHIHNCNIYVNAQNLLTITNYKVSDPEQFNDFTTFPIQRIIVAGLNFNF